jgi:hypothetical protein
LWQAFLVQAIREETTMAAQAKKKKKPQADARQDRPRSLMQRLAELERALLGEVRAAEQAPPPQAKAA